MRRAGLDRYVVIQANGMATPLFWVTPDFVQFKVVRQFGPCQPVYGLSRSASNPHQLPLTFDQIAAYYVETIRSVQPRGPYALAGYCIAAVIAREIACQLLAQGERIKALVMVNPSDPALSRVQVAGDPLVFKARFGLNRMLYHLQKTTEYTVKDWVFYYMQSMSLMGKRLRRKITSRVYRAHIQSGKPLPPDLQDVHQSDIHAFMNYVPRPYPGDAVILRPAIKPEGAFDYSNRRWAQLVTGALRVQEVPGDSDSMWQEPDARELCRAISFCLEGAASTGELRKEYRDGANPRAELNVENG